MRWIMECFVYSPIRDELDDLYQMDLSNRLSLRSDQLENLRGKVKSFENDYQVLKGKLEI
ncbi:hypothetical protein Glove_139g51 [Diversispora epigaea]|uniref:Uncharacterized protein n=1 Tax=Diversispora epigaea TaxID=1348612 RepID=A0A397J235_9GLOM|nr:hypothetical protein Glove_139g51 [Diversispora epigaea]